MKTIEERFADALDHFERQTAEWEKAAAALVALSDVTFSVPAEALAELDAVVKHVQTAAGGVQV